MQPSNFGRGWPAQPQAASGDPRDRLTRLAAHLNLAKYRVVPDEPVRQSSGRGYSRRLSSKLDRAWTEWIHSTAKWSIMVTLTFKRHTIKGFRVTPVGAEKALRHLLRLINCDLYGKRRVNRGWTIGCAAVIDFGVLGDHPHAHLLLAAPDALTDRELCAVVERAVQRTALIDRQRRYRQYFSAGGADYLIGHGTDRMVMSLLAPAYPGY